MSTLTNRRRLRVVAATGVAAALTIGLAACGSSGGTGGGGSSSVAIVGYSTPEPAYDALEKAFQQTPAGKGVTFSNSFDSSGSQSKSVEAGQAADYVTFSTGPDMTNLVPKYVAPSWDQNSTNGLISKSVVVLVVRQGNPKKITGWNDLTKSGIGIVTPDPASSGSAKWNLLAAYEQVIASGGTPAQAEQYLKAFFGNVVAKPTSGSDALTTFEQGTGDVLLSYEDEAIRARAAGDKIDYIVPSEDVEIDIPAAVTKSGGTAAKAFLDYCESDAGQKIFVGQGFRPINPNLQVGTVKGANDPSNPFPTVSKLVTVDSLGGWDKVQDEFFGDNGIVTKIENP